MVTIKKCLTIGLFNQKVKPWVKQADISCNNTDLDQKVHFLALKHIPESRKP